MKEGGELSPVLEPRKAKAASWEVKKVRQQALWGATETRAGRLGLRRREKELDSVFLCLMGKPSMFPS